MILFFYIPSIVIYCTLIILSMILYHKIIEYNHGIYFDPEIFPLDMIMDYSGNNWITKIIGIITLIVFGAIPVLNLVFSIACFFQCYKYFKKNEREFVLRIMNKLTGE